MTLFCGGFSFSKREASTKTHYWSSFINTIKICWVGFTIILIMLYTFVYEVLRWF